MSQGKQRLEAMRKMLKKKQENNALAGKQNNEVGIVSISQDENQNQDNIFQQGSLKEPLNEQKSQNRQIQSESQVKPGLQEKQHSEDEKEQSKSSNQDMREQGEIDDEESVQCKESLLKQVKENVQAPKQTFLEDQKEIEEQKEVISELNEQKGEQIVEQEQEDIRKDANNEVENKEKFDQVQQENQQNSHDNKEQENPIQNIIPCRDSKDDHVQQNQQLSLKAANNSQSPEAALTNLSEAQSVDQTHTKPPQLSQGQSIPPVPIPTPHSKPTVQSSKPAFKVVLKELQMIKSSIHNLAVTYRGVQFLRNQINKDPMLKKRIKQRLQEQSHDGGFDVLRKMVKKTISAQNPQNASQNIIEQNLAQKQHKPTTPATHKEIDLDKNVHKSRESIQQDQALMSKQMIEA